MRFIIFVWAFMFVGLFLQLHNVVVLKSVFLTGKLGVFPCNEEGCTWFISTTCVSTSFWVPPHHVHMLLFSSLCRFPRDPLEVTCGCFCCPVPDNLLFGSLASTFPFELSRLAGSG